MEAMSPFAFITLVTLISQMVGVHQLVDIVVGIGVRGVGSVGHLGPRLAVDEVVQQIHHGHAQLGDIGPLGLTLSLGFASGAMLYVVFGEIMPESLSWVSGCAASAVWDTSVRVLRSMRWFSRYTTATPRATARITSSTPCSTVTLVSGAGGTGLGGLIGALFKSESNRTISLLLAFAGGVTNSDSRESL